MRGFFSKHTFTDLLSDLGLHLLHLKQRFLPVAFRPSALCAVHNKSCETQHAISQWQHAMQWWSSKCVWDSERGLNKRVCLWQHVKRLFLFKIWAWTGISGAKIKRFLSSSKGTFNTGTCAKMHARSNFTPTLPTHPARARHTQLHQVCRGEGTQMELPSRGTVESLCFQERWSKCRKLRAPEFRLSPAHLGCPLLQQMHIHQPRHDLPTVHSNSSTQHTTIDTTMASSLPPSCTLAMMWRKFPTWTWEDRKNGHASN